MHISPARFCRFLLAVAVAILLLESASLFAAQTIPLDPKASSLTFVGDAFMHSFHGEARDFTGSATLDTSATPPVQKATLHFKTAALTTFHEGRDKKMWEWLKINAHPDATFALESVKLVEGDVQKADSAHPAKFVVNGALTLNGVKQSISGNALGWRAKDRLIVSGETVVDTLKYGLPQIREAFLTVGTNVKTTYRFAFVLPPEFAAR
jgi:polyisoprenoid-binding protein YceI